MRLPILLLFLISINIAQAQYNQLTIPDTLSGPTFNLSIEEGTMNWFGSAVNTAGINPAATTNTFWGPTLIFNKGDTVHMNVTNNLMDTTTIHWHGMHLQAEMDGGPHQPIAPGATWSPYWKVDNLAATYWYHPHLHMMAEEQLLKGIGGLIIIRDSVESSLSLPRTYGVDDIPLVLSDRAFVNNQISIEPYGDSMMVNGVIRAEWNAPSQVVRFRILNGGTERSYNLGFSDGSSFYVITSDGGLLNAPVPVTRYLLSSGERIEILVDLTSKQGQSFFLKAYNSTLAQSIPGGDLFPGGPFANYLARTDFNIIHINVGAPTANPVTVIPSTLTTVNAFSSANATLTRHVTISDTNIAGNTGISFVINHHLYTDSYIDYQVPLGNTEIWEISNSGNFSHPFHIHDVEFNIFSRNGATPPLEEQGWKDVVLVKANETVKFVTRFDDFADSIHPYMFHCHIALHEDEGMMGQFVVVNQSTDIKELNNNSIGHLYPNPVSDKLIIEFRKTENYSASIYNSAGKLVSTNAINNSSNTIDVSLLPVGIYLLQIFSDGEIYSAKFIRQ
jgi:FtsP/CotA-like multicopper oxidase with cupredoxin domain